jgi:large subunit ribosomal protein L25
MSKAEIQIELRDAAARTPKALRREGKVPGIFYSRNEKPIPFMVPAKALQTLLHQHANIMDTVFPDGKIRKGVVREVQRDPVSEAFVHVDIMGISLTEKVKLFVPVVVHGIPAGVKDGGVLEHPLREIEMEGLPLDIPEHVDIDVAQLTIGQNVTVKDLAIDTSKVRVLTDLSYVVVNVSQPKIQKVEEAPVAEAEVAEAGEEKKEEKPGEEKKEEKKEDKKEEKPGKEKPGKEKPGKEKPAQGKGKG